MDFSCSVEIPDAATSLQDIKVLFQNTNEYPVAVRFRAKFVSTQGYETETEVMGVARLEPRKEANIVREPFKDEYSVVQREPIRISQCGVFDIFVSRLYEPPSTEKGPGATIKVGVRSDVDPNPLSAALLNAIKGGDGMTVGVLLDRGADPSAKESQYGYTALMLATRGGYATIVSMLLSRGADVNAQASDGYTALMFSAQRGDLPVAKLLLNGKAKLDLRQSEGYTALGIAGNNDSPISNLLKSYGATD